MKLMFILIMILSFFNIAIAGNNKKDSYTAPVFKKNVLKNSEIKFVKNWDDNSNYKFKDKPENERAVASDPDDEKVKPQDVQGNRDPSSINNKKFQVRGWDILPSLDY